MARKYFFLLSFSLQGGAEQIARSDDGRKPRIPSADRGGGGGGRGNHCTQTRPRLSFLSFSLSVSPSRSLRSRLRRKRRRKRRKHQNRRRRKIERGEVEVAREETLCNDGAHGKNWFCRPTYCATYFDAVCCVYGRKR